MAKLPLYLVVLAFGGCLSKADNNNNNNNGNNYLREQQHNNNDLIFLEGSRLLQEADENVSCAYFISDLNNFTEANVNYPPQEECGEDFGPAKCCTYDVRRTALNGEGLFQVEYASDYLLQRGEEAPSEAAATCYAYVDNLQDTICSRNQGNFISADGTFSICQSSCDTLYATCVTAGIVDSSFATDGTSFCENAWVDPCTTYADGYFCTQGVTLSVVDATEGCAVVDTPTEDDIEFYQQHSESLDACMAAYAFLGLVFGMWILIICVIVIVICCCCIIACVCCCK